MIRKGKKVMAAILSTMILTSTSITAFAAENDGWTEAAATEEAKNGAWETWCKEWENIKNDWTQISVTPGKDASQLNFAWYSLIGEISPKIKVSKNLDMSDAKEFTGYQTAAVTGYLSNKITITGLEENTKYYYSYGTNGKWSEVLSFNTQSTKSFGFFLVGDPQIGSSVKSVTSAGEKLNQDASVRNDTFNWNNTINKALSIMPNASFMISAGDQIQSRDKNASKEEALLYTGNEIEYAGYLSPSSLKSLPVAASIGNHDGVSGNYSYHFNNPNASELGKTIAGGDYYYTYGNTLFIMLNTNNSNVAEHKKFLEDAIHNNPNATWKVVTLHQDIYGSGEHSNEPEVVDLRYKLIPILEENHIDVVFSGHDHTYARSKILKGGKKDESAFLTEDEYDNFFEKEFETNYTQLVEDEKYINYLKSIQDKNAVVTDLKIENEKIVDPDGILYITADSPSGSKYYNNVPRKQEYIAERWQEYVPTFSTINVDEGSLSISTYRTDNLQKIDKTFTIVKSSDKSYKDLNTAMNSLVEKDNKVINNSEGEKKEAGTSDTAVKNGITAAEDSESAQNNKKVASSVKTGDKVIVYLVLASIMLLIIVSSIYVKRNKKIFNN